MTQLRQDRLQLDLNASKTLFALQVCVHGVALFALLNSSLADYYQVAFSVAIVVSLIHSIAESVFRHLPHSILAISFIDNQWRLTTRSGDCVEVELRSPLRVFEFLIAMRFRDLNGNRHCVCVFPDTVDETQMRRARLFFHFADYQPKDGGTKIVSEGSSINSG